MPKIKLFCNTGFAGASHNDEEYVDDDFWSAMTADEREKYLEDAGAEYMVNSGIEYGAYLASDDEG
jgi:hypothetical protein